ncbi:hypothetical protein IW261DRAFT_1562186 [Armillaria novae-zelandiae]|uniref:Uncharacterized protein n=1 Tax=Armillaria novae-zelandiae TaxID=153914 RepID=A0AA39TDX6_9AGAR|nr:hypothetical protein IW261DRAFT_1562186 [Armillaria novae-zelandiae]
MGDRQGLSSSSRLKNLDYNIPGSNLYCSLSVVDTAGIIKGTSLPDDRYLNAAVLGGAIELIHRLHAKASTSPSTIDSYSTLRSVTFVEKHLRGESY